MNQWRLNSPLPKILLLHSFNKDVSTSESLAYTPFFDFNSARTSTGMRTKTRTIYLVDYPLTLTLGGQDHFLLFHVPFFWSRCRALNNLLGLHNSHDLPVNWLFATCLACQRRDWQWTVMRETNKYNVKARKANDQPNQQLWQPVQVLRHSPAPTNNMWSIDLTFLM